MRPLREPLHEPLHEAFLEALREAPSWLVNGAFCVLTWQTARAALVSFSSNREALVSFSSHLTQITSPDITSSCQPLGLGPQRLNLGTTWGWTHSARSLDTLPLLPTFLGPG